MYESQFCGVPVSKLPALALSAALLGFGMSPELRKVIDGYIERDRDELETKEPPFFWLGRDADVAFSG